MTPLDDELRALRDGCGLLDRRADPSLGRDLLRMTGPDRGRFLGGLVTHEVKTLEPGRGSYGFVTNIKGRVLADMATLALDDAFWLMLPAGRGEAMAEHLGKYKIADRVELTPVASRSLSLVGPRAEAVLRAAADDATVDTTADTAVDTAADGIPVETWDHRTVTIAGRTLRLVREHDLGVPCFGLWSIAESADRPGDLAFLDATLETVRDALVAADPILREMTPTAVEALRILAGRSRYGIDYGVDWADDTFPQETGFGDEAVSYTKGCYLGQEVVARIHYRGGVNRQLRGLVLGGPEAAARLGCPLLSEDGREAGRLTSVATVGDRTLGLAIVHKRVEPGASVILGEEDGDRGRARVVELPFV